MPGIEGVEVAVGPSTRRIEAPPNVVRDWLRSCLLSPRIIPVALAATLFFAIHPLRAESVGWATERRDVLSGLFYLLTILMYLKACDANGKRRGWLLAGSVGLYVLALVSKASVMVLPLALVV